jgi:peptidoglycan-associated lipoprotein
MTTRRRSLALFLIAFAAVGAACGKKKPPVATPTAPPQVVADPIPVAPPQEQRPTPPPPPPAEPPPVPMQPLPVDEIATSSIDDLNKKQVLKPIYFALDSDEVDAAGQQVLVENAQLIKKYNWTITLEGHCDERGSAEYNLALGERRALSAKNYLVSLGIPADRVKTVSYGKEFPFDPGHDEAAFAKNRRAHFVVTAK